MPLDSYRDEKARQIVYNLIRRSRQARDLYRQACETQDETLKLFRGADSAAAYNAAETWRRILYGQPL